MPGVTVVVLTGAALGHIAAACSVARALQPSVVVVEDVDLIAEQRDSRAGQHPLLFQLLNEMDGLGEDADVTFVLTTNRADLLEAALAQRPGRVDHAAELPLPDADARRRLIRLYQHDLVLDLATPATVITRTEGVTASFLKELLRRAAMYAAEDAAGHGPGATADRGDAEGGPLTVRDEHMNAALDELLDSRNQLTQILLGGHPAQHPPHPPSRPRPDAEAGDPAGRSRHRPRPVPSQNADDSRPCIIRIAADEHVRSEMPSRQPDPRQGRTTAA